MVDLPSFRRRQGRSGPSGRYLGIGMATYIEAAPGPKSPRAGAA